MAAKKKAAKKKVAKKAVKATPKPPAKTIRQRANFRINEFIVYPTHGVGQIVEINEQEIAEHKLEFFSIKFKQERMMLKVPVTNIKSMGMRKLTEAKGVTTALAIMRKPAKVKRTMWSRRAQEYEQKINSGDLKLLCEVVRDLHRADHQPEQSYSERQLYEQAFERLVDEVSATRKQTDEVATEALHLILNNPNRFDLEE